MRITLSIVFDLRKHIQFETLVVSAIYNEMEKRWHVTTDDGVEISAKYCIMADRFVFSSANTP